MKKFALVLCVALVGSLFAACGEDTSSAVDNNAVSSTVSSEVSAPADPNPVKIFKPDADGQIPSNENGDWLEADVSVLSETELALYNVYKNTDVSVMLPDIMMQPLDADISESFVGVPADRFAQAAAGDAAMGSLAHSVAIVKAKSLDDVDQLKADIEANADPRKWICVEAEKVIVDNVGDTIILIMSDEATADAIHTAFLATVK